MPMPDLRLTLMSDTHQLHRELDPLPGGDLLIHCGDFTMSSRINTTIADGAEWVADQPYRHKVVLYGNHEFAFEANPRGRLTFERRGAIVLLNESVALEGLTHLGQPRHHPLRRRFRNVRRR